MIEKLRFEQPVYVTRPALPKFDAFAEKLRAVWDCKWLTNHGPQHAELEYALAEYLKAPHLSLFNNGTIALLVACQSLKLSGEVITTPFTFPATTHVLAWNNISPVFCDINPVTMNIDVNKIESAITSRTTGILAVHVYGTPCDMAAIQTLADRHGLRVIYDAAHAFGVEVDGAGIGSFGDVSMFSFHATKLFHTAEGGALTYGDANLKERIYLLRNFGIRNEEEVLEPGINGKMNELQAALGLTMLECVQAEWERRKEIDCIYRGQLGQTPGITLLPEPHNVRPSYQYFVIRIDRERFGRSRDEVHAEFKAYNVFTRKYFFPLCSDFPCYSQLSSASPLNLTVAHKSAGQVLCLPFYGELSDDDAGKICAILLNMRTQ